MCGAGVQRTTAEAMSFRFGSRNSFMCGAGALKK